MVFGMVVLHWAMAFIILLSYQLQPPAPFFPATSVKPAIDAILARYRIKRNSFYFTGLSQGAWQANLFVAYEPTAGDNTYGRMVKAIVNLEGVIPSDDAGIYSSGIVSAKDGSLG